MLRMDERTLKLNVWAHGDANQRAKKSTNKQNQTKASLATVATASIILTHGTKAKLLTEVWHIRENRLWCERRARS